MYAFSDNILTVITLGLTLQSQPEMLLYSENPSCHMGDSLANGEAFLRLLRHSVPSQGATTAKLSNDIGQGHSNQIYELNRY